VGRAGSAAPRAAWASQGATGRPGSGPSVLGEAIMQSAQPRDLGALILVIGVFLVLFVVTLTMGSPVR
jgi:hypothetical protein